MIKTLLKYMVLGLFLLTASNINAQVYEKFPTNIRYIGGGFNNKRPYFKTLEAALNDVKPTATPTNPYGFWISSDTLWIADWDSVFTASGLTMKDSIDIYYVATGLIKWFPIGFGGGGGSGAPIVAPDGKTYYYEWDTWNPSNFALPLWQRSVGQTLNDIDEEVWRLIVYTESPLFIQNDTLKIDTAYFSSEGGWDPWPDTTTVVRTSGNQTILDLKTFSQIAITGTFTFNDAGGIQLPNLNGGVGTPRKMWGNNDVIFYSGSGGAADTSFTAMINNNTKQLKADTSVGYSNLRKAVKDSLGRGGTLTFDGKKTSVAKSVTGMTNTSIVVATPVYADSSTAINTADLFVVIPYNGGFYLKRGSNGTSNLKVNWSWIRKTN